MRRALIRAMGMLEGSYALGVICDQEPNALFCARNDSPLVIGAKDGEGFIASDIPALLRYTRDVIFLQDKGNRRAGPAGREHYMTPTARPVSMPYSCGLGPFQRGKEGRICRYMLKEISQQPTALQSLHAQGGPGQYSWLPITRRGGARASGISASSRAARRITAGMVEPKYAIERLARVPVEAEIASEYRYRDPIVGENELFIAVSQSGETADTLAALREAKRRGARVMAICNVVGSTITREAGEENTLYTYAGPEIAVASTKAYITQAELMVMLAVALADLRGQISPERAAQLMEGLADLPRKAEQALAVEEQLQRLTSMLSQKRHVFFVGRGMDYALSMEAALKLKEVSYIFSEAYAAGELKHGPIALLKEGRLVVAMLTQPALLEQIMCNLREVAARGARS